MKSVTIKLSLILLAENKMKRMGTLGVHVKLDFQFVQKHEHQLQIGKKKIKKNEIKHT